MKYLDLTLPTPEENVACDERLLAEAERGDGGEVLRVWESPRYFVAVGYGNRMETEVDVTACRQDGIPILRRCSGGGAVVQGPGCLSYALILKIANSPGLQNIAAANRFIMERNRAAIASILRTPRSAVEVQGHTDLALVTRDSSPATALKFSGNAQRRRRRHILFHGTFLLNFDLACVSRWLPMPSRQPDYRAGREHRQFLANLDVPADKVKAALRVVWGDEGRRSTVG